MIKYLLLLLSFGIIQLPLLAQKNKLAPPLFSKSIQSNQNIRLKVNHLAEFETWFSKQFPTKIFYRTDYQNILSISNITFTDIQTLSSCPFVDFIDVAQRKAVTERELGNLDLSCNQINWIHQNFPLLNGKNLQVSIKEKPFDTTDFDFKGRILTSTLFDESPTFHATTMATILAGAGNSSAFGKGVAWQSNLTTADYDNLPPDANANFIEKQITVQNHSYGVGLENYYGIESQQYDQQTIEIPTLLHIFSAGNVGTQSPQAGKYLNIQGFANLTGQFKISKNTISMGASDSTGLAYTFSSKGPTDDGRIKPELVAYGEGGTSDAAAICSGVSLLLQQAYLEKFNQLPKAELIKAMLINGADDVGRMEVDFENGFGKINAQKSLQSLLENRFFSGEITQNQTLHFPISIPENTEKLKITLVWHDKPAEPNSSKILVNDLDLTLNFNAQTWLPWILNTSPNADSLKLLAKRGIDRTNNVEQITLENLQAGTYQIQVLGFEIADSQTFSLVYQFEKGFEWTNPTEKTVFTAKQINPIRWNWAKNSGTAKLEYKIVQEGNWHIIDSNLDLSKRFLNWIAPDTFALAQFKMTIENNEFVSDTFLLGKSLLFDVALNCDNQILLTWNKQLGASAYQILNLREKFLEKIATTQDTLILLDKSDLASSYLTVLPVLENYLGLQSATQNMDNQTCYLNKFLPKDAVSDKAIFEVELSSFFQLESIDLERLENDIFVKTFSKNSITQLNFEVEDLKPNFGKNTYRLKLNTTTGKAFYSQMEDLYFLQNAEALVFPNPIQNGEFLNVLFSKDESIEISIYNAVGKLIQIYKDEGLSKTIPTAGLEKGMYFLKLKSTNGFQNTQRIVVY